VNDFGVLWLLAPFVFAHVTSKSRLKSLFNIPKLLKNLTIIIPAFVLLIANEIFIRANVARGKSDFIQSPPSHLLKFDWVNAKFQISHFIWGLSGGILIISPVIFYGLYCWYKNAKKEHSTDFNLALGTILVFNTYIVAIWQGYGGEYGYRYMFGVLPFLSVTIMVFLKKHSDSIYRKILWALTIWGFYFYWVYNVAPETMMLGPFKYPEITLQLWNPDYVINALFFHIKHPASILRCFGLSLPGAVFANITKLPQVVQYQIEWKNIGAAFFLIPTTLMFFRYCENSWYRYADSRK
jgi:hypothetical protein